MALLGNSLGLASAPVFAKLADRRGRKTFGLGLSQTRLASNPLKRVEAFPQSLFEDVRLSPARSGGFCADSPHQYNYDTGIR